MATAKSKTVDVEYRHDDVRGEHQIGAVIDGQFVAFATVDDAVAKQRVENASNQPGTDDADGKGGE